MANRISFSIDNRERIEEYAKEKGFQNAAALARFAVVQYMNRYPGKNPKAVQPDRESGKK